MKTIFALGSILMASSAFAEYRFEGEHPFKLTRNDKNEVVASLCYEQFTRCTGSLTIGSFPEISLFIQSKIWNRQDVNLSNYENVLKSSLKIVKDYDLEVKKRQKKITELSQNDPQTAQTLQPYLNEAKGKLSDANAYVERLINGKKQVLDVLSEVEETFSGHKTRTFEQRSAYNFRDFQWNYCRSFHDENDCFQAGLQFYLTDVKGDLRSELISKAIRSENSKANLPKTLSSGLTIGLLKSDLMSAGALKDNQNALPVPMEVSEGRNRQCQAVQSSGVLKGTNVSCQSLSRNWRYPSLKELQLNRAELMKVLNQMEVNTFFQTTDSKGFVNPGAAHLTVCKPVYYNLSTQKTLNNQPEIVREFIFGKEPSSGASAICVCSENC